MINNVHALFSQILVVSGYACNCQGWQTARVCSPITLHVVLYQYFHVRCLTLIKLFFYFFHEEVMSILFFTTLNYLIMFYSKLQSHI